jgi:ketosteroid isomerase-like protein
VTHPNEIRLRQLYRGLDTGDLDAFLAGCTDDVTFLVPGLTPVSGLYTKASFEAMLAPVINESPAMFLQHLLAVAANDDDAIVLLFHRFSRHGQVRQYRTAHKLVLRDGLVAAWEEHPGCRAEFEAAWGGERGPSRLGVPLTM